MDENTTGRVAPGIVVGVDGTVTALRAVGWAAVEARVRGTALRIVHAAPYADDPDARTRAASILALAYTTAHRGEPGIEIHTDLVDAAPVPALTDASDGAELLVVGMAGGRVGEVTVGSTAVAVSGHARCPVAVVRGRHRSASSGRPVLLAVDDVQSDAAAVTVAFADADRHGTALEVLHVRAAHLPGSDADATAVLEDQLARWRRAHPAVEVRVRLAHGRPEEVLLEAADQARLVVVSTCSHGPLARIVLGSCTRALVRHSPCPVCVVGRGGVPEPTGRRESVPAAAIDPHDPAQLW